MNMMMEREQIKDEALREALARMQPAVPEGMSERFAARLQSASSRDGAPRRKDGVRRFAPWGAGFAAVAAAAVLVLVFLPRHRESDATPAVPAVLQEVAIKTLPATEGTWGKQPALVAVRAEKVRVGGGSGIRQRGHAAPMPEAPRPVPDPMAAGAPLEEEATPWTLPEPAASVAIAERTTEPDVTGGDAPQIKQEAQTFTPRELELMARAERMRPQTTLYTAETVIEQRVAARERNRTLILRTDNNRNRTSQIKPI